MRTIHPTAIAVGALLAAALAAVPAYRWWTDSPGRQALPPATSPLQGAIFMGVAIEPPPKPERPPAGGPVKAMPPLEGRYLPITDAQRKAWRAAAMKHLEACNVPIDTPNMNTGAKPNAVGITLVVFQTPHPDQSVTVTVQAHIQQQAFLRKDSANWIMAITMRRTAEMRVARTETDRAVEALARQLIDLVVQRYRDENSGAPNP